MKIGYPTHPRKEIIDEITWAGKNGFGFVDLFMEPDAGAADKVSPEKVRTALDQLELDAVGHLAWYLPTGSPFHQLRKAAIEIGREYISVFAEIGVSAVTVHANWASHLFTDAECMNWQIESTQLILDIAKSMDISIMYEPIGSRRDSEDNLQIILNAVPELLCHLDLGHCNLFGKSPQTMIRRFADRLNHIHLHDNFGDADLHLPPGTGIIDWKHVFRALKDISYNKTVTLEVFSNDRDYILLSKKKVEEYCRTFGIPVEHRNT